MKIKTFDRANLKELRSEINSALVAVGKKYNITINAGNASFAENEAHFKLNLVAAGDGGELQTKGEVDFKRYASQFGLTASDLGRQFNYGGEKFKVIGLNPKAHRFPISAVGISNGRRYKFPVEVLSKG